MTLRLFAALPVPDSLHAEIAPWVEQCLELGVAVMLIGLEGWFDVASAASHAVESFMDVEQAVIDELNALGPEAILSMLDEELKVGAKARVIRGIFTGSEGEIIRLESPQKRIALLLSILGSDQPVELPLDDVEGLPDEA